MKKIFTVFTFLMCMTGATEAANENPNFSTCTPSPTNLSTNENLLATSNGANMADLYSATSEKSESPNKVAKKVTSLGSTTTAGTDKTWDFTSGSGITNFGSSTTLSDGTNTISYNGGFYHFTFGSDYGKIYTSGGTTELTGTTGLQFNGTIRLYSNYIRLMYNTSASIKIPVNKGQLLSVTSYGDYNRTSTISGVTDLTGASTTNFSISTTSNTQQYVAAQTGYVIISGHTQTSLYIQSISLSNSTPVLTFQQGSSPTIDMGSIPYTNAVSNAPSGSTVTYAVTSTNSVTAYSFDTSTGTFNSITGIGTITVTATSTAVDNYNAATATYTLTVNGFKFSNVSPSIANGTTEYQQQISGAASYAITSHSSGITAATINTTTGALTDIAGNGIIKVTATASDNTTTASYVLTVAYSTHIWNFYSNTLTFGESVGNTSVGDAAVYKTANDSPTYDYWTFKFKMTSGTITKDPLYAYNNAVTGDNGLVIGETTGLQFFCDAQKFGVNNGSSNTRRYVAIQGTSTIVIPKLKKGQYVKIYWDPYAGGTSGATFTATNLNDLDGTSIDGSFPVSGVAWTSTPEPFGLVIFQAAADGDASLTLTDNGWNDLIKIETTNEYSTDLYLPHPNSKPIDEAHNNFSFVHQKENSISIVFDGSKTHCESAKTPEYSVTNAEGNVVYTTTESTWTSANNTYKNLTLNVTSGTGNLKVTEKIKFGNYVLDKKMTWLAIGEYTQQTYPYTWDFTNYNMGSDPSSSSNATGKNSYDNNLGGTANADTLYGNWKNAYQLQTLASAYDKVNETGTYTTLYLDKPLFAQGSQLCYGTTALPETEGLKVAFSAANADNIASIDGSALKFASGKVTSTLTVPAVGSGMYVFIKASAAPSSVTIGGTAATAVTSSTYALNDGVYLYQNTGSAAADVAITAKSIDIYKIGVTNINKNINKDGKTTESRDHAIDYNQSGAFTQNSLQPFYAESTDKYSAANDNITLTPISVVPANTGLVLYNTPTTKDENADDVPLFYPAVNIPTDITAAPSESPLKPNVSSTALGASTTDTYLYVFTNKFYYKGNNNQYTANDYGFYKVNESGTLAANKAYLQLSSSVAQAKSIVLLNFEDETPTGINNTVTVTAEPADEGAYYNLNGLQLTGKPVQKGIYIHNGKKVLIK